MSSRAPSIQNLDASGLKSMIDLLKSEKAISEMPLGSTTGPDGRTKLDITPEEMDRIQESFKNAEFRKMFSDYYDEITDPKYRAETEAYLRQLEEGGETPKDMKIVKPNIGWAFEARMKNEHGGFKVYINVVHDKCVKKYIQKPAERGFQVSIPNMTGTPRFEVDLEVGKGKSATSAMHPVAGGLAPPEEDGRNILTVDVCFHPETVARTLGKDPASLQWHDMIMKFAAECADTRISQDNYGGGKDSKPSSGSSPRELTKLDPKSLKFLPGVRCVGGTPGVLGVRDTHEGDAGPAATSSAADENAKKSTNPSSKTKPLTTPVAPAPSVPQPPAKSATVVKTGSSLPPSSPAPPPPAPAPVMRDKNGIEMRPPTSQKLVHQGAINLSDHMSGPSQQAAVVGSTRPESLKLTFVLKGVTRAAMIDCEVEEKRVLLRTDPIGEGVDKFIYYALISLPFPILKDDPRTKSKWTRDTCTLDISMQVQKPEQLKFTTTTPNGVSPSMIQVLSSTETTSSEASQSQSSSIASNTNTNSLNHESDIKASATASSSSSTPVTSPTPDASSSSSSSLSNPNSRWIKASLPKVEPVVVPPQLSQPKVKASESASGVLNGGEPPFHWSQTAEGVRIIVDVPFVVADSVKVERLIRSGVIPDASSSSSSSSSSSELNISISFVSLISPSQLAERIAQGEDPVTPTSPNIQKDANSYSYCLELPLVAPVRLPSAAGSAPVKVDMGTSRVDVSPLNVLIILAKDKTHKLHQSKWASITRPIAEKVVNENLNKKASVNESGSSTSSSTLMKKNEEEEEEEEEEVEEEVEEIYELGSGGTFDLTKAPKRIPKQQKKKIVEPPVISKQTTSTTTAAKTSVSGMPKCSSCGGWGVSLVSEITKLCAHCTRLQQTAEEKKTIYAKKEVASTGTAVKAPPAPSNKDGNPPASTGAAVAAPPAAPNKDVNPPAPEGPVTPSKDVKSESSSSSSKKKGKLVPDTLLNQID